MHTQREGHTDMQTLTNPCSPARRWARILGTGALALGGVALAGTAAGAASSTPASAPLGASGSVAALAASSMEVQNPSSGQTTVDWTGTTTFAKTVSEAVGSISSGTCITVTGTPSKSSKTTIAARSITVLAASSTGSCTTAARGGVSGSSSGSVPGGGFPGRGGFRFARPGGAPGGANGSSGAGRRFPGAASFSFATGQVTSVSGTTLKVSGINVSPGSLPKAGSAKNAKSKKVATPKTQKLTVTTSSSTTVSATQSAAASDLAVGACVTAFGPAATNGAITATTVRISPSTDGSCSGGFGRFGGFGGGAGPGSGGARA
jgi:hypothetical protein